MYIFSAQVFCLCFFYFDKTTEKNRIFWQGILPKRGNYKNTGDDVYGM